MIRRGFLNCSDKVMERIFHLKAVIQKTLRKEVYASRGYFGTGNSTED